MHKMASRRRQRLTLREQPHFITHAGASQPRHADAGLDGLRKCQRGEVVALRLHHQADGAALVDVQRALVDQVAVHRRVEPAVIDDVVHMAVHIVVGPAGGDGLECAVVRPRRGLGSGGGGWCRGGGGHAQILPVVFSRQLRGRDRLVLEKRPLMLHCNKKCLALVHGRPILQPMLHCNIKRIREPMSAQK